MVMVSKIEKVKTLVNQRGGWRSIFEHYACLRDAMDKYPAQVPCPRDNTGTTVFRLVKGWEDSGQAFHNSAGRLTDGLNVLSFALGLSISEVADEVLKITGGDISSISQVDITKRQKKDDYKKQRERERILKKLQEVYEHSFPAFQSPIAMNYLRSRGLTLSETEVSAFADTLGFHPSLELWNGKQLVGRYPALLGFFKDANGNNLTIHRIYLKPDGNGYIDDPKPKRMITPPDEVMGGAFRLGQPMKLIKGGKYLGVAEGIETALAVYNATKTPCWSMYSDWVLSGFKCPDDVNYIGIWADKEPSHAGINAANRLKERLESEGTDFLSRLPPVRQTRLAGRV
jgi:hypothetical protein